MTGSSNSMFTSACLVGGGGGGAWPPWMLWLHHHPPLWLHPWYFHDQHIFFKGMGVFCIPFTLWIGNNLKII